MIWTSFLGFGCGNHIQLRLRKVISKHAFWSEISSLSKQNEKFSLLVKKNKQRLYTSKHLKTSQWDSLLPFQASLQKSLWRCKLRTITHFHGVRAFSMGLTCSMWDCTITVEPLASEMLELPEQWKAGIIWSALEVFGGMNSFFQLCDATPKNCTTAKVLSGRNSKEHHRFRTGPKCSETDGRFRTSLTICLWEKTQKVIRRLVLSQVPQRTVRAYSYLFYQVKYAQSYVLRLKSL